MSDLPFSTSDKRQEVRIRPSPGLEQEPKTVVQNFDEAVAKYGTKPALHQKIVAPVSSYQRYSHASMSHAEPMCFLLFGKNQRTKATWLFGDAAAGGSGMQSLTSRIGMLFCRRRGVLRDCVWNEKCLTRIGHFCFPFEYTLSIGS